jgi:hypothetical protein
VVVVDVGHVIELYAEFTRSGATYTPFPDPRSHRIRWSSWPTPPCASACALLWTDPLALDPARASARVTREVAAELADLAAAGSRRPRAADRGRLPHALPVQHVRRGRGPAARRRTDGRGGASSACCASTASEPDTLARCCRSLWAGMDRAASTRRCADGAALQRQAVQGRGGRRLRAAAHAAQIDGLLRAARANWREVEPAIFGTLLERALDPTERHALGAHYTPRAYVERLVLPTVVEPLRADWADAQAAALLLAREAEALDGKEARDQAGRGARRAARFHHQLCSVRVLDPACGSGNFLYVTLEHLKRLEGEVLDQLAAASARRRTSLGLEGETVTLQQLRGIELNERAAALAELVLWIGWLQWQIRTAARAAWPSPWCTTTATSNAATPCWPMTRRSRRDADGRSLTRWDGTTRKPHPVTGEGARRGAQVPQWRYVNPRPAEWPQADFIVGNPPFIGNKRCAMRWAMAMSTRCAGSWPTCPTSADFVMYWWHHAAELVRAGAARRFGFITTNSLRQTFNRRVVQAALDGACSEPVAPPASYCQMRRNRPAAPRPRAATAGWFTPFQITRGWMARWR